MAISDGIHDIEAEIHFLATDSGGRRMPVMSGYRPNHDFGIPEMINDAQHEYIERDRVGPGDTVKTRLWFLRPDLLSGWLYVGMSFTVQEGTRLVGNGKITRVCNPELEKAT